MSRLAAAICALALLLAACGDDGEDVSTGDTSPPTTTEDATTTSTTSADTTTTTSAEPAELPGEPIDIFPYEGATLAVVGVEADDVLNVRRGPGVDFDVELTLEPTHIGATATGNNRQLDEGGIWAEITHDGMTGWASTAYLLQPGEVTDVTAEYYPTPADRPSAGSMDQLAMTVADDGAPDHDTVEITLVDGPTVGDLGEATVDVIGLRDDSVGGYRLHVVAEPGPGDTFTVRTIERTVMCLRGVTDDGLCL